MAHSTRYFRLYDSYWDDALTCKMFNRCGYPGMLLLTALWTSAIQILWDSTDEQQSFETPLAVLSARIRKGKGKTLKIIQTLSEENPNFSYSFSKEKGTITFQYPAFVRIHSGLAIQRKKGPDNSPKGNPNPPPKGTPKGTPKAGISEEIRSEEIRSEEIRETPKREDPPRVEAFKPKSETFRPIPSGGVNPAANHAASYLIGVAKRPDRFGPATKFELDDATMKIRDLLADGVKQADIEALIHDWPYPYKTWKHFAGHIVEALQYADGSLPTPAQFAASQKLFDNPPPSATHEL